MFTKKRKHALREQIQAVRVNVKEHEMLFKQKASHWLAGGVARYRAGAEDAPSELHLKDLKGRGQVVHH